MLIFIKKVIILALNVSFLTSEFIDYKQNAETVLNFFKEEQKLRYLSIVTFDSNNTKFQRMIYRILSSEALSKEAGYFVVHHSPTPLQLGLLSDERKDDKAIKQDNILILTSFSNSYSWKGILSLLSYTKVKSSILLFVGDYDGYRWNIFKDMLDKLSKNSMFYVVFQHQYRNNELAWHLVTTLNGYKTAVVDPLKFDFSGKVIKGYDMQGLHIVSITESWAPYFTLLDCDSDRRNCKNEGYLTDVMNILGSKMNFTWESHGEKDGIWGTTAISGPSNSSGVWGGVVGSVFNGTYQLSVSAWVWNYARNDMFDYIPVVTDRMVLAIMKKSMRRTPLDLFFRPFTKHVWVTMGTISVAIIVLLTTLFYLRKYFPDQNITWTKTNRKLLFIASLCFLLLEIHFESTLTMFLTTYIEIPLNSVKDVIREYPDWRLLMRSGLEVYYIDYVDDGDEDYIRFWNRVKSNPEENTFKGIQDLLKHFQDEPVVIHELLGAIDAHTKYIDGSTMEHLTIFNKGRVEWYGMIVTENSPLGPMLQHGSKDMQERGLFSYLQQKWLKGCETCRPLDDHTSATTVLDLKQVSFLFIFLGGAMFVSLITFLVEKQKNDEKDELISSESENTESVDEKFQGNCESTEIYQKRNKNLKKNIFNYVWNT